MSPLMIIIFILVQYSKINVVTGINCECTTDNCVNENKSHCRAPTACFREYLQESADQPIQFRARGCVSEHNSLLCDNNLVIPSGSGPRLYLECCSDRDMCNTGTKPSMHRLVQYIRRVQQMADKTAAAAADANLRRSPERQEQLHTSLSAPSGGSNTGKHSGLSGNTKLLIILASVLGMTLLLTLIAVLIKLVAMATRPLHRCPSSLLVPAPSASVTTAASSYLLDPDQIYCISLSPSSSAASSTSSSTTSTTDNQNNNPSSTDNNNKHCVIYYTPCTNTNTNTCSDNNAAPTTTTNPDNICAETPLKSASTHHKISYIIRQTLLRFFSPYSNTHCYEKSVINTP